jgi:hypothetical protein
MSWKKKIANVKQATVGKLSHGDTLECLNQQTASLYTVALARVRLP